MLFYTPAPFAESHRVSKSPPSASVDFLRAWCAAALLALVPLAAHSTVVTDLYQATVDADRGQAAAFQDAMRRVIVRVTGERDGDAAPELADLITNAQRYVQTYRNVPGGKVAIGFDGKKVVSIIAGAGKPVWGRERPATLVWLAVDDSANRRRLVGAGDEGDLKAQIDAAADGRGLPLVWPKLDATDVAHVSANDVWSGSTQKLLEAAARYRADAVLIGKMNSGYGEWTLAAVGDIQQLRGGATDGVNALADRLSEVLAASGTEAALTATLDVSGVDSLASYADLITTLEASSLIRSVSVTELAGDRVVLALNVRGTTDRLRRALAAQRKFEPLGDSTDSTKLFFRYRP